MSKLNLVMKRLHSGAKLRILQDRYGQKKVEMKGTWLPIRRCYDLTRDEVAIVEVAMTARSTQSLRARTVTPVTIKSGAIKS